MYDINDKIFLCDWIQGTLDMRNVNEVFEFLCSFDCFDMRFFTKFSSGFLNYKERWGYNDTGIVQIAWNACDYDNTKALIFSDDRPKGINGGILLSISGDGLRKIGYENHNRLFKWLYEHDFRCTRFDVAMDIFDPNNLLVPCIIEAWEGVNGNEYGKNTISTLMNKNNFVIHTYSDTSRKCVVKNVEIQQNKGHLGRFKMYDKWYEVHKLPRLRAQADELCKDIPAEYWYRLEYTIKTEYSESLFKSFCENDFPLEMFFKWAVGRMFTIKVAKTSGYQTGQLDTNSVWIDLISYLDRVTESRSLNFNLAK